ncbi:M20 metallopeptidase family protein [Fulvivirga ligni]|uniref:M20 metallopeptidase family protein n=1 Tax=Fulvivirga ligni TaxID=2904246 RepID=UPI001F417E5E|nr:M20/M25/M40 family metallo-hydrolase [Fulvivirga ligni]UII19935.1 M20/M25/M40 family metallo-hydrolase [Fulvivirga ligni]
MTATSFAQTTSSIHASIQQHTNSIYDTLVQTRRYLHRNPELGGQEKNTSAFISAYLENLGLEVKTNIGGYGLVGILRGDKEGKKIAWRADIDAIHEHKKEEGELASNNEGVGHHCGHDVHTTIALGMAEVLAAQKENLHGTIYFIFQHSEENYQGALEMIDGGLFDIIDPEEMYAAHLSPMPSGLVATKEHYLFADYKQINITYKKPSDENSISEFTKGIFKDLQNVAPDSKFWDTRNLMDPNIGLGHPNTIFKNFVTVEEKMKTSVTDKTLTISAFVSTSNAELMKEIPGQLLKKIGDSRYADQLIDIKFGSDIFSYSEKRGNIDNDTELATKCLKSISDNYGASSALTLYGVIPDGRGDDFSYFQEKAPCVYFLLGGSNYSKGIISMPHTPAFSVDETCIKHGVNYFSSMLADRLNN